MSRVTKLQKLYRARKRKRKRLLFGRNFITWGPGELLLDGVRIGLVTDITIDLTPQADWYIGLLP